MRDLKSCVSHMSGIERLKCYGNEWFCGDLWTLVQRIEEVMAGFPVEPRSLLSPEVVFDRFVSERGISCETMKLACSSGDAFDVLHKQLIDFCVCNESLAIMNLKYSAATLKLMLLAARGPQTTSAC